MGVKLGKAFGAHTTVISRGTAKKDTAIAMGADAYLDSTDDVAMKGAVGTFDFILNTVSAKHNVDQLLGLVGFDGIMVMVGGICILYVYVCICTNTLLYVCGYAYIYTYCTHKYI